MRKAAEFHKTARRCVEGVAESARGTRFLAGGDTEKRDEHAVYFSRCPICGKENVKEGAGFPAP
jgi:hypothetical protein